MFALSHGVASHPRNLTKHGGHDGIKQSGSTLPSTELIVSIISSRARHSRLLGSLSPLSSGPVVANRSLVARQKHRVAATTLLQMGYPDGPGRHHPLSANLRPLPQRKTRRPHGGRRLGSPCQEGVEANRDAWQRHPRRTRTVA